MGYDWSNISYQEKKARRASPAAVFAFAILFVFLILAAQYESWTLPMSVLLGTPFAALGAFLGLSSPGSELGYVTTSSRRSASSCWSASRRRTPSSSSSSPRRTWRSGGPLRGGGAGGGQAAPPADPHDGVRLHPRRRAAACAPPGRARRSRKVMGMAVFCGHARGDHPRRGARAGRSSSSSSGSSARRRRPRPPQSNAPRIASPGGISSRVGSHP